MIGFRDLVDADLERIYRWRNLPDVAANMYSDHVITPEEHARWFAGLPQRADYRYWIVTLDSRPVGLVNLAHLDRANRRTDWGFYLAEPDAKGRGVGGFVEVQVMRVAFDELGLNKLYGEVLAFNTSALAFHERHGYRREGCLRQHVMKDGRPHDVVPIGMLRDEWLERRADLQARYEGRGRALTFAPMPADDPPA
jgi:UDP-4-amino-4,6-dideoxy-N-acetyl-beta-L-altrosamine N-acetyltransferase